MTTKHVYWLAALNVAAVFFLVGFWEFVLEGWVDVALGRDVPPESLEEHWEYVTLTVVLAALALVLPVRLAVNAMRSEAAAVARAQETRKRFRALVELAPDAILVHREGRVLYANPAAVMMFGARAADELEGQSVLALFHPDSRDTARERLEELRRGGSSVSMPQMRLLRKDGRTRDVEVVSGLTTYLEETACQSVIRDISDLVRSERERRTQAQFLELMLDTMPVPIFYKDREGHYLGCNRAFEEAMGIAEMDLAGKTVFDLLPFEIATFFHNADQELFESLGTQVFEADVTFADGKEHAVVFHRATFGNEKRPDAGLIGAMLDITERKESVTALRHANADVAHAREILSDAIESISEAFVLCDAQDRLVVWNSRYEEMYPEIVPLLAPGRPFEDLIRGFAETQVALDVVEDKDAWVSERLARHWAAEGIHLQHLGDGRWVQVSERRTASNGIVSVRTDITRRIEIETALKDSEERYQLAIEAGKVGVWDWNLETGALYIAPNLKAMLGYDEDEIADDVDAWSDLIHPDDLDRVERAVEAYLEGRTPYYEIRYRMRHRDGSARWFVASGVATRDEEGKGVRMIGTDVDVTSSVRVEEALRAAKENAEVANRAKTEFLANMSHELRTPLNSIIGFSDILAGETFGPLGNPEYREYAKDINDSGHHLLSLINDILDVSRIETEALELTEQKIDVAQVCASCIRLVSERARKAGLKLEVNAPRGLSSALLADERRVKQVLLNLLANSVKFTEEGGSVSLQAKLDEDDRFVFSVRDTGIGIAPQDIDAAMSTFGQVDGSLARKYEGAGLGLPLSKKLVELHGGTLILESEPGVGTVVTVHFPRERTLHLA